MADQLSEPWSLDRDEAHPVRWSPADGDTPAYLTFKGALERLSGYYVDPEITEQVLASGAPLRTPFAFYQIDEPRGIPVTAEPGSLGARMVGRL